MSLAAPFWVVDDSGNRYDLDSSFTIQGTSFERRYKLRDTLYRHGSRDISDGRYESREFVLVGRLWSDHGTQAYLDEWHELVVGLDARRSYLAWNVSSYYTVASVEVKHKFIPAHPFDVASPVSVRFILADPWNYYGDPFLEPSLALWFDCNESAGDGTVHDQSANSNHGTLSGATPPVQGVASMSGFGSCIEFDSADTAEGVNVDGTASDLQWGTGEFMYECWANVDAGSEGTLISKTQDGDLIKNYLRVDSNGYAVFHVDDNAGHTATCTGSTDLRGAWHHFLCQREIDSDAGTDKIELFVDGTEVDNADASAVETLTHDDEFRVGRRSDTTNDVPDAKIDSVRVVTKALDDTYITRLYDYMTANIPGVAGTSGLEYIHCWKKFVTIGSDPQTFSVTNYSSEAFPRFIIKPGAVCTEASITNVTDGNTLFGYEDLSFGSGDTLVVDCAEGTVERDGANMLHMKSGQFLRLLPDATNEFTWSGCASGTIEVWYRGRRL